MVTCNVTIRFGMDGYMVVQTLLNHLKSERKFGQFNCKLIKFENNHGQYCNILQLTQPHSMNKFNGECYTEGGRRGKRNTLRTSTYIASE